MFISGANKKTDEKPESGGGLKRNIGLLAAVNILISVMIGSGIFVSPTAALQYSGSIGLCLVVWTACGFISLMGSIYTFLTCVSSSHYISYSGALCFAELGTVIPRSGGEYAFLLESFSKLHPFWGPLPAFICSWLYVVVLRPAAMAVVILTFAEYSIQPFSTMLGLNELSQDDQQNVIKLIALLGLGELLSLSVVMNR